VQGVPRDGLGIPVLPIVMGVGSAVAAIVGKKKKPKVMREAAKSAVAQIYLELLGRDPWNPYDAGAEGFVNCLVEGWCETDFVRTEVLKSSEYRDVEMRRAAQAYGALPAGGALVPAGGVPAAALAPGSAAGGLAPFSGGGIPSTIAGIPLVWLIGGVALLMLLRRGG